MSLPCLLLCRCWRMNFLNMPSFVSMLTYEFLYHAFFCVDADIWISLTCLLLCRCWRMHFFTPSKIFLICLHSLKTKPFVHVWGRKSRSSVIKNRKSFHLVHILSRQWRLINFRMHRSDDCRSWNYITNVNNYGCWGEYMYHSGFERS